MDDDTMPGKMEIAAGKMNTMFDDFASRMALYKLEACLPQDPPRLQLLIMTTQQGFKLWVNKIKGHSPAWIEVITTLSTGRKYEVSGMMVSPVATMRSIVLAEKDGRFFSSLSNALTHAFDVQVNEGLFKV